MVTEISISENFLEEYLPRATIEILPPLPCDNLYLPDSGRHVTSVHQGLSQAGAGEEPGVELIPGGSFDETNSFNFVPSNSWSSCKSWFIEETTSAKNLFSSAP